MSGDAAAHAGISLNRRRAAVSPLRNWSLKIVKLRALNDFDRGSTVTIGTIKWR